MRRRVRREGTRNLNVKKRGPCSYARPRPCSSLIGWKAVGTGQPLEEASRRSSASPAYLEPREAPPPLRGALLCNVYIDRAKKKKGGEMPFCPPPMQNERQALCNPMQGEARTPQCNVQCSTRGGWGGRGRGAG